MVEVYTHFGRVIARFPIGPNETHHRALEEARRIALQEKARWIRFNLH